jgi:cupin superfamily acireductone dioxygenase involved in methionine salvage
MIITRWQAPIIPNRNQIVTILESEGLEPFEEVCTPHKKVSDHRHPFAEVRVIVSGEILFNISGNQFVLRAANTKHSHVSQGSVPCVCICANKAI